MNIKYGNINSYINEIKEFYPNIKGKKKEKIDKYVDYAKQQSILGEYLLKELLKKENIDYNKIIIETNKQGKPYIENYNIFYNISHSNDYVICITSNTKCGVDIEMIKELKKEIINYFATNAELNYIYKNKKDINKRAIQIYTLKEAYYKMLGTGLKNLKDIEFYINKDKIECSDQTVNCSSLFEIDNYIISLCTKKD